MTPASLRAVFLDRDGTLLDNDDYLGDPAGVRLYPKVSAALREIGLLGWERIVVTNQSGVARGLFTEQDYRRVEAAFLEALEWEGGGAEAVYVCHHLPGAPVAKWAARCECRKPAPGLFLRAARERGIDLARSVSVGDMARDLEAGRAAGVGRNLLVRTGKGREEETSLVGAAAPDAVLDSVADLPAWLERLR